jgi:hypothetical protein
MKARYVAKILYVISFGLIGAIQPAVGQPKLDSISFIDLSKFDSDMERALNGGTETVTVTFYEKTSPNNMPTRLQKWVTSVEKSGGKIEVEPPSDEPRARSPVMLIGLLGGLWSSIKAWGEIKEKSMLEAAQSKNVKIYLERNGTGDIIVSRVTFSPR